MWWAKPLLSGLWRSSVLAALVMSAACTTSGSAFDTTSLDLLTPGQTTLTEASTLLKSEPTNVYRQQNGAATARWAHHSSMVPDAVYFNRELWLYFDENGVFQRVVKSNNVPFAEQQTGQGVVRPPQGAQPVQSTDSAPASEPSSDQSGHPAPAAQQPAPAQTFGTNL